MLPVPTRSGQKLTVEPDIGRRRARPFADIRPSRLKPLKRPLKRACTKFASCEEARQVEIALIVRGQEHIRPDVSDVAGKFEMLELSIGATLPTISRGDEVLCHHMN